MEKYTSVATFIFAQKADFVHISTGISFSGWASKISHFHIHGSSILFHLVPVMQPAVYPMMCCWSLLFAVWGDIICGCAAKFQLMQVDFVDSSSKSICLSSASCWSAVVGMMSVGWDTRLLLTRSYLWATTVLQWWLNVSLVLFCQQGCIRIDIVICRWYGWVIPSMVTILLEFRDSFDLVSTSGSSAQYQFGCWRRAKSPPQQQQQQQHR